MKQEEIRRIAKAYGDYCSAGLSRLAFESEAVQVLTWMQENGYGAGSPWVSVKDGLPEDSVDVFVAYRDRYTGNICYSAAWWSIGAWYSNDDAVNTGGIVAWLPIPEYEPRVEAR